MSDRPHQPLRQRLIDDMTARRFSKDRRRDYAQNVRNFTGRSPDTATREDLRRFQLHMAQQHDRARDRMTASQRSDMGVAIVTGQHGEHRHPHNVALLGRVGTAVARLEEMDEERQLPKRRRPVIPFDTHRTKETVEIDAARPFVRHSQRLPNRPVSRKTRGIARHAPDNARFASKPHGNWGA